jgi:GNAT superfamily N-acetyltransferase
MNKLFLHIVSLLLIVCLVADPVTTASFTNSISPTRERAGLSAGQAGLMGYVASCDPLNQNVFQQEALILRLRYFIDVIRSSKASLGEFFPTTTRVPAPAAGPDSLLYTAAGRVTSYEPAKIAFGLVGFALEAKYLPLGAKWLGLHAVAWGAGLPVPPFILPFVAAALALGVFASLHQIILLSGRHRPGAQPPSVKGFLKQWVFILPYAFLAIPQLSVFPRMFLAVQVAAQSIQGLFYDAFQFVGGLRAWRAGRAPKGKVAPAPRSGTILHTNLLGRPTYPSTRVPAGWVGMVSPYKPAEVFNAIRAHRDQMIEKAKEAHDLHLKALQGKRPDPKGELRLRRLEDFYYRAQRDDEEAMKNILLNLATAAVMQLFEPLLEHLAQRAREKAHQRLATGQRDLRRSVLSLEDRDLKDPFLEVKRAFEKAFEKPNQDGAPQGQLLFDTNKPWVPISKAPGAMKHLNQHLFLIYDDLVNFFVSEFDAGYKQLASPSSDAIEALIDGAQAEALKVAGGRYLAWQQERIDHPDGVLPFAMPSAPPDAELERQVRSAFEMLVGPTTNRDWDTYYKRITSLYPGPLELHPTVGLTLIAQTVARKVVQERLNISLAASSESEFQMEELGPDRWTSIKKELEQIDSTANAPTRTFYSDTLSPGSWVVVMKHKSRIIGYVLGIPLEDAYDSYPGVDLDRENYGLKNTVYIFSIALLPKFQGRDLEWKLRQTFLNIARRRGFSYVSEHRPIDSIAGGGVQVVNTRLNNLWFNGRLKYVRTPIPGAAAAAPSTAPAAPRPNSQGGGGIIAPETPGAQAGPEPMGGGMYPDDLEKWIGRVTKVEQVKWLAARLVKDGLENQMRLAEGFIGEHKPKFLSAFQRARRTAGELVWKLPSGDLVDTAQTLDKGAFWLRFYLSDLGNGLKEEIPDCSITTADSKARLYEIALAAIERVNPAQVTIKLIKPTATGKVVLRAAIKMTDGTIRSMEILLAQPPVRYDRKYADQLDSWIKGVSKHLPRRFELFKPEAKPVARPASPTGLVLEEWDPKDPAGVVIRWNKLPGAAIYHVYSSTTRKMSARLVLESEKVKIKRPEGYWSLSIKHPWNYWIAVQAELPDGTKSDISKPIRIPFCVVLRHVWYRINNWLWKWLFGRRRPPSAPSGQSRPASSSASPNVAKANPASPLPPDRLQRRIATAA